MKISRPQIHGNKGEMSDAVSVSDTAVRILAEAMLEPDKRPSETNLRSSTQAA